VEQVTKEKNINGNAFVEKKNLFKNGQKNRIRQRQLNIQDNH